MKNNGEPQPEFLELELIQLELQYQYNNLVLYLLESVNIQILGRAFKANFEFQLNLRKPAKIQNSFRKKVIKSYSKSVNKKKNLQIWYFWKNQKDWSDFEHENWKKKHILIPFLIILLSKLTYIFG